MDEKTLKRFWSKVNMGGPVPAHRPELGPCWIWTASADRYGYGQLRVGPGKGRLEYAHRLSWLIQTGEPAGDSCVLHKCDSGPIGCVNPAHLFLGTRAENSADMVAKGRQARGETLAVNRRGEKHNMAKLSAADVLAIRELVRTGEPRKSIAARFQVSKTTVKDIVLRRSWSHI